MNSRRSFLKKAGVAAGISASPFGFNILHAQNKGDKLKIAFVGVGGINARHTGDTKGAGDIVTAYCDVDTANYGNYEKNKDDANWKDAKGYQDYRKMFDEQAKNIDAVVVGTPDHHHYPATALAIQNGKHVFTQKPLVHTVWEARQLLAGIKKNPKLATQMGNQGHANDGNRRIYSYVNSGMLGDIKEIHCVTNRPIWPQGGPRPEGEDPVPSTLDWDLWIGPAQMRPYKKDVYHPFKWRGFYDFGGGALADMACHTMDCIFMSLNPGYPISVEVLEINGHSDDMFPAGAIMKWTYGPGTLPNGKPRPGFEVFWYEGKLKNDKGEDAMALETVQKKLDPALFKMPDGSSQRMPQSGNVLIGTKNSLLVTGDYGDRSRVLPEALMKEFGNPPKMMEPSIGHHEEWRQACLQNKPELALSNFSYAAPFTETILLGNAALKVGIGKKLEYDSATMSFKNAPEANKWLTKEYRKGWEVKLA